MLLFQKKKKTPLGANLVNRPESSAHRARKSRAAPFNLRTTSFSTEPIKLCSFCVVLPLSSIGLTHTYPPLRNFLMTQG